MNAWLVRGAGLGALTVALRVVLGFGMIHYPTHGSLMRVSCLIVLVGAVVAWGVLDGLADRRRQPDPDRPGTDLLMRWLRAAVVGGLGSGLVAWLLGFIPALSLGGNPLLFELTAGASFIVLLIFIPGMIGTAVGHKLADRGHRGAVAA
ncbi:B-4DMT family transporter [Nocardia stercoris]|uniref:Uncharacterized protein n=1 Tax=Nocardia stercoris TaxID=2483361 RepID=A0A3M2L448_9NOCA|nr:B-4DMT family transporter [Nocardia stercoris]RMI30635.1 hypothetical protein EBN03_21490 [Nocardia stercoris]